MAGSANVGEHAAMFEAIHGSATRRAGQNLANPSGLLQGGIMMMAHIGQSDVAERVHNAWLRTIEEGIQFPYHGHARNHCKHEKQFPPSFNITSCQQENDTQEGQDHELAPFKKPAFLKESDISLFRQSWQNCSKSKNQNGINNITKENQVN